MDKVTGWQCIFNKIVVFKKHHYSYYIIAEVCVCVSAISTVFHDAALNYWSKKYSFFDNKSSALLSTFGVTENQIQP